MAPYFTVIEHRVPGQHIREYPTGLRTKQEDVAYIAVKQYIPQNKNVKTTGPAITIIGGHANGFIKEMYEPYMELLCLQLNERNIQVRSVWMADSSHQGASGVMNEHILGDQPSWFDHSRDLLQMINTFRDQMSRPLVGIGHSFSCAVMINLSIIHPRLLSALILCEPVLVGGAKRFGDRPIPALLSSKRRDVWNSRAEAEAQLRKAFKNWDPRAMALYVKYGLRSVSLPARSFDTDEIAQTDAVTLTTSKHQESWTFVQLNLEPQDEELDRLFRPDQDPVLELDYLNARPEASAAYRLLPHLRPNVFWVHGSTNPLSSSEELDEMAQMTGTGIGGSGGAKLGKVHKVVLERAGHLMPFEKDGLQDYVRVSAEWLEGWFARWQNEEKVIRNHQYRGSDESLQKVSSEFVAAVGLGSSAARPHKTASGVLGKL